MTANYFKRNPVLTFLPVAKPACFNNRIRARSLPLVTRQSQVIKTSDQVRARSLRVVPGQSHVIKTGDQVRGIFTRLNDLISNTVFHLQKVVFYGRFVQQKITKNICITKVSFRY